MLQPQLLADVLARVFTAKLTDDVLVDGVLSHQQNTLYQVTD